MALKAHLELIELTNGVTVDGRRNPRRELKLQTSGISESGAPANVTIHNLSAVGLLIETDLELVPGERLAIGLPDVGPVGAEIVWVSERLYGCAFEQALGEAELAASELKSVPTFDVPQQEPAPAISKFGTGNQIGPKLNRLRRERSLTLEQVANALGVSKPTVWAWEKGKARPLPERIGPIAQVLGVPEAELTGALEGQRGAGLVEECRVRIASEYGISPECVRIMIEV
ncbi:MAG: helix-turn-helix domain-containing protein [Pseudomonadota bacterium]